MKPEKHKVLAALFAVVLGASITLGEAAPIGISESVTVEAAKNWIGVKEVHGGNNTSGIDCSHLVYQVYKHAGIKDIEFQTVPKMKNNMNYVTIASPRPGDLIFWKRDIIESGKKILLTYHVGIYIGNDQFIHPNNIVTTDNITGIYKDGMPYYARWYPQQEFRIRLENLGVLPFLENMEKNTIRSLKSSSVKGI